MEDTPQNLASVDEKWNGIMKEDLADSAAYQVFLPFTLGPLFFLQLYHKTVSVFYCRRVRFGGFGSISGLFTIHFRAFVFLTIIP